MKKPKKKSPTPSKTKARLPAVPKTPVWDIAPDEQIVGAVLLGKVRDYQADKGLMTLVLEAPLAAGETIRVKGSLTDLTQRVERMDLGREASQSASPGDAVAIAVADRVRVGDAVYKL